MRIGSPIGGGVSMPGSPSNDFIVKATGMPSDVEAAITMVGLSGAFGNNGVASLTVQNSPTSGQSDDFKTVKDEPTDFDDVPDRTAECQFDVSVKHLESVPRSGHIVCPVMPERHSFVQRALKRKIENRMEPAMVKQHVDASTSAKQLADTSISDNFSFAKRCRLNVEGQQHQIGRFVRTSQPCLPDGPVESFRLPEVERDVGRFVRTGQPCHSSEACSVSMPVLKNSGFESASLYNSVESKYFGNQSQEPNAKRQSGSWHSQPYKTLHAPKVHAIPKPQASYSTISRGSPSGGSFSSAVGKHHIPFSNSNLVKNSSQLEQTELDFRYPGMKAVKFGRQDPKTGSPNALYSLGQYAASMCLPAQRRQEFAHISDFMDTVESHKLYSAAKQRCSVFSEDISIQRTQSNENSVGRPARVKSLDIRTERKVTNGEFGSLHSLQIFYSRLNDKSAENSVSRNPLSSITNQFSVGFSVNREVRDDSWQCSGSVEEKALDLSLHSNRITAGAASDAAQQFKPSPSRIIQRKSLSCCSSPVPSITALKRGTRETSTEYIDRLLLLELKSDLFETDQWKDADNSASLPSSPFASSHSPMDEKKDVLKADDDVPSPKSSPCKPDNMLPLKKRRLVEMDNSETEIHLHAQSPTSNDSSYVHVVKEESDATQQQIADVQSRSRCIASTITQPDGDGNLPLHIAVVQGQFAIVTEIIKMMSQVGASLDVYNNLKQTALHTAVLTNQPDIVRLLLIAGASPNVVDHNGLTSIHHASKLPSATCLRCIVDHSTVSLDLNAITYHGLSALHLAVKNGNVSTIATLLEAGAYVDIRDTNGRTPLFYAVEHNDSQLATVLLECGADPSLMTYSGCSPATVASSTRCSTEVARLLNAYATADGRCHSSVLPTVCLG